VDTRVAAAPQTAYQIQGREVRLPVEVRDATAAVAYYSVPVAAAQRVVDPTGLRVAGMLPGRTLVTIGAMDYRDGDLGPYHEIAVSFFVRERGQGALPVVGGLVGLLRGGLGAYIYSLPVDGEFTREAGLEIWGFPKFITEIELSDEGGSQRAVLRHQGRHILTQTVRCGGSRSMGEREQVSYALRDGAVYRTPATMAGEQVGFRFGGGTLELGEGPLADELRTLGLPKKPLFTTWIGRMTGCFLAAVRLPASGG
jgi:hypothetical protein